MSQSRQVLSQALAWHQAGQLERAEEAYRSVLSAAPDEAEAWQLLGALAHQTGRVQLAIDAIGRALAQAPPRASWLYNLANALVDAGRLDEAQERFAQAVQLDPQLADAYLNWGATLERQGDFAGAAEKYHRVLQIEPASAQACSNLGSLGQRQDRLADALEWYNRALSHAPNWAVAWANRASVLRGLGQMAEAEQSFRRALQLAPDHFAAWHNLGELLQECARLPEAAACYRQALELRPDSYETRINLGGCWKELGDFRQAEAVYRAAIDQRPERFEAWSNRGLLRQEEGMLEEAEADFAEALRRAPTDGDTRLNRALLWLQQGRWSAGWQEYGWRWQAREARGRVRRLNQPPWNGQPLGGRRLLVLGEQGVGDEIMFASCLPDLLAEAHQVTLTCDARLERLFARSFPAARVQGVVRGQESWDEWARFPADFQASSGDLPRYLRREESDFPRRASYLVADPQQVDRWRLRLAQLGPGPKIGVSWRGGKQPAEILRRSAPLTEWQPLWNLPGVCWVNLQYGPARHEAARWARARGIDLFTPDDADPLGDFDPLAALTRSLDLVISVANATVHLAGGLGVPCWVLLPPRWGWRWLLDRPDSPWYPSVRIWRQTHPGEWSALIERVAAAAGQFAQSDKFA